VVHLQSAIADHPSRTHISIPAAGRSCHKFQTGAHRLAGRGAAPTVTHTSGSDSDRSRALITLLLCPRPTCDPVATSTSPSVARFKATSPPPTSSRFSLSPKQIPRARAPIIAAISRLPVGPRLVAPPPVTRRSLPPSPDSNLPVVLSRFVPGRGLLVIRWFSSIRGRISEFWAVLQSGRVAISDCFGELGGDKQAGGGVYPFCEVRLQVVLDF
jgi:hypothetical protein